MEIKLTPIGIVHTHGSNDDVKTQADLSGELEIFPQFAEGLDGIEDYSHIFVMAYFDRLRPEQIGPLKVKPRGLLRRGFKLDELPLLGVFAVDSPTRPNPVGLTLVRLLKRQENRLHVQGLDFFDGTPILDIKSYSPRYRADAYTVPDWHRRLVDARGYL